MPDENFEIRDLRHQEWLWTSKNLLFHKSIDEKMYKVYSGLAAFANNNTQKAFPSILTLMQKLHMGRNTVIRALQQLEKGLFISVEREPGKSNVYSLLEVKEDSGKTERIKVDVIPENSTQAFFKGIRDLKNQIKSPEAENARAFLIRLKEKYPMASKEVIWKEIQKFESYWTEKNSTGTKERWQKQTVFEVDRRLVTWFIKKDEFKRVEIIGKFQAGKAMAIKK